MRLEGHHLLKLPRMEDLNRRCMPAVAEPHVRRLHLGRHTRQARVLVAPVELVGLAGIKARAAQNPATVDNSRHRRRQVLA